MSIVKWETPQDLNEGTQKKIQGLTKRCRVCQAYAPKPVTFRVSMPQDEIVFNHEIDVDLFLIEGKATLHIIDRGTRYSIALFF